jgi:hypothetical protein
MTWKIDIDIEEKISSDDNYTAHRQVIVITFPALRYYSSPPSLGHAQNLAVRAITYGIKN